MTDDDADTDAGVFDSDPRHLDSAGNLANLVKSGAFDIEFGADRDTAELHEFIERAETEEFSDADPGLEATVCIARALLADLDDEGDRSG